MPRTVNINWGDGSPEQQWTGDKGTVDHVFPPSGTFTVTVTPTDGGAPKTTNVSIPCNGGGTVTATVACDAYTDPTGRTVTLTVTGATGAVTVDWGDGGYPETVTGTTATHTYAANITGPQTVTVTHTGTPVGVTGSPITIPCGGSPSGTTAAAFAAGGVPGCVRPLVTGVRVTGAANNEAAVTIAHPGGSAPIVAVIYQNGAPVAQSAPLVGPGETAPVGPLAPGNYVAKACQSEGGTGYPTQCCETGEGFPFAVAG